MGWADRHIAELALGKTVQFRPHGNSMQPRIKSGQLVTVRPIEAGDLRPGGIVLCKVKGRQFLHLIGAVDRDLVRIENASGHVNGWTSQVYGVVTTVA
jgi:hypothetical protein